MTSGMSLNVARTSRATAWIQTSRVRIHSVSDAGTVRPCAVFTSTDQAASEASCQAKSKRATV